MLPPFESAYDVLSHARDHIYDLDGRLRSFFQNDAYVEVVEYDAASGQDIYYVKVRPFPGKIFAVTKDAFCNLRDALDHAVYASAQSMWPGRPTPKTAFAFGPTAAEVHRRLNVDLIHVPPSIRTLIENLQPHATGNALLWGLNHTRNIKVHQFLIPLGTLPQFGGIRFSAVSVGGGEIGYSRWHADKAQLEFMRAVHGAKIDYTARIACQALFEHSNSPLTRQPIVPLLHKLASEVESIVLAIEAETRRVIEACS